MNKFVLAVACGLVMAFSQNSTARQDGVADNSERDKPKAYDSAVFNQAKKGGLEIIRVTPNGDDVPVTNRQIVFKFNQPVVPVGKMQRDASEIPIKISPAVNCEWLWLDTSSLSCQLTVKDSLTLATRYRIEVSPGIVTSDGIGMKNSFKTDFLTLRPAIRNTTIYEWKIADKPVINVNFNQPVTRQSVLEKLSLKYSDNPNAKPIRFEISRAYNPLSITHHTKAESDKIFAVAHGHSVRGLSDEELKKLEVKTDQGFEARYDWVVAPVQPLPLETSLTLHLEPGLVSAFGVEPGLGDASVHTFKTLPEFKFLGITCSKPITYEDITLRPEYTGGDDLRAKEVQPCNPQGRVSLQFSTPVSVAELRSHLALTPDLAGGRDDYDPWVNYNDSYRIERFFRQQYHSNSNYQPYSIRLPEKLKAYQQYSLATKPDLRDELNRPLPGDVDMGFHTAHRDTRLVFEHRHSVLEKGLETETPVTVTNLNELTVPEYSRLTPNGLEQTLSFAKPLANVEDVAYKVRLGVRELLGEDSGVVEGYINSDPVTYGYKPRYYRFFSQVTPYQVHYKFGHFNSLAWVTDMRTGKPVADAEITLYVGGYRSLETTPDTTHQVQTDKHGVAMLPGLVEIDPQFSVGFGGHYDRHKWFVRVQKDQDMALLPIDYPYEANSDIWANLQKKDMYMHAWGTTAQGIYKVGDTIQFKFYVRNQSNEHWVAPDKEGYVLKVIDPKGQAVHEVKSLTLSDFGAYAGEFKVSAAAAVGWYQFELTYKSSAVGHLKLHPMRVLVSDFTPAPFRVSTELNGDQFQPGDTVSVTSLAKMHAGGPYADAETRVTATLNARVFRSTNPEAKGFNFYPRRDDSNRVSYGSNSAHQSSGSVDKQGELVTSFALTDFGYHYGRLSFESAVRDERGKYVAGRASADYIGRDVFVGLRNTSWVHNAGKATDVEVLTVDAKGQPVAEVDISVMIEHQVTKAARVKSAGNAYLTQYSTSWEKSSECQLTSTLKPVVCDYTPTEPGSYRLTASVKDSKGRENSSQIYTWVVGKGAVVWSQTNDNRLQIVADKERYKIGDTAKFLVKNPYPGVQAIITVERYGVLRHWRQTLDGSTPIIEVPIKDDDYPGVYLSVVVASPRVAMPLGDGEVDLGKPTFKMGYAKVPVIDIRKELEVKVTTDKDVYKPRDKVRVKLSAKPRSGDREPIEAAVVVIDEAVFDLNVSGRSYYDPYQGFNRLDGLGVANYNLLMRLVGRQNFPKKGANPGGGGGEDNADLRSLMKFVSYWNPSIKLDKRGKAKFDFELPDNLTGWRVFVLAATPNERMGLGDVNFKVNRPTELRPIMPNQVTEGDQFQAGFSVMNRTDKPRTLTVEVKAAGDALVMPVGQTMEVELGAFERKKIWLPVTAKNFGEVAFLATAGDKLDRDALEHHVPVNKRRSLITGATYGTTTQDLVAEKIALPDDIYDDVGGISLVVAPSVIANISGAFRYLRYYPYYCWEQRLSKGLAAAQYGKLKDYLPADLDWPRSDATAKQMLSDAATFQASNGGMTYWVNSNEYVSPYLSAYTALGFTWLREQGYTVPAQVESKLHGYLKTLLRQDSSLKSINEQYSVGLRSSVRAVALAALAKSDAIDKQELLRYQQHVPKMDLFGKAHYLQAALELKAQDQEIVDLTNDILSYSVQSGGKFQFNEVLDNGYQTMLATPMRTNCAILSTLLEVTQQLDQGMGLVGDVPFKQVRAITQTRGNRDHWENTQENIFCMNALIDYSKVYESEAPDMQLTATFKPKQSDSLSEAGSPSDDQLLGQTSFADLREESVTMSNQDIAVKAGLQGKVELAKQGPGRVYYGLRVQYASKEDNAEPINAGIEIKREYSVQRDKQWVIIDSPLQLEKGELVRVDIFLDVPTARHFVVVDDPVPGGLEPVNRDLATASLIDAAGAQYVAAKHSWWYQRRGWVNYGRYGYSFYHKELRHDSARFYSDYLPIGNYHLSYTAQAIAGGTFSVMPVKAEEMYDPDVYGLGLPATLKVEHAK